MLSGLATAASWDKLSIPLLDTHVLVRTLDVVRIRGKSVATLVTACLALLSCAACTTAPKTLDACQPSGGHAFICGAQRPEDVARIPDTPWLVFSGFSDGAGLKLVDTRTHRARVHVSSALSLLVADVAFAPDGRTFATGESTTGTRTPPPAIVVVRDARTGAPRAQTDPIPGGRLVGYTQDGRYLLVVSGERRSLLLDARTLRRVRGFPLGGATAVSPSSDDAAFGRRDGDTRIVKDWTSRLTPPTAGRRLSLTTG